MQKKNPPPPRYSKATTMQQKQKQKKQVKYKNQHQGTYNINYNYIAKNNSEPLPISTSAKRLAYDKVKKIETLQKQKGKQLSYQQLCKQLKQLIKDDLQLLGFFIDQPKSQIGRAILLDGSFYISLSKINFKSQFLIKQMYLKNLKSKYLPKITQNKQKLQIFITDQQQKIQQQKKKQQRQIHQRLSLLSQKDIYAHPQINQQQIKRQIKLTRQQKILKIKKNQSFLIDFFQINDVYDDSMIQVIGIIDQIDDQYAIMLIKQKKQQNQKQIQKQAKQVLAIALMKQIENKQHKKEKLKQIQKKHQNIFAYVHVQNPQTVFFNALPDDSVKSQSIKKQNPQTSFQMNFTKNRW